MGSVLVVEKGNVLFRKNYGFADLEWNIQNSSDTEFRVGSLTKQFTAALVLALQEQDKLKIGDHVSEYLSDCPASWSQITISNLLHHTSGIPELTADSTFANWSMLPHSHADTLAFFRDKPLLFAPGSRFQYSNSNYEVLGAIVEKLTGKTFGGVLADRILKPLGLNNTGVDTDELVLRRRAQGYRQTGSTLIHARSGSMSVAWAAGGLYTTVDDLLLWAKGLFGGKLLSKQSLQEMTTAGLGDYGLGVEIRNIADHTVVQHGGSIDGFNSYLSYVPDEQIAVIVLSNVEGVAAAAMAAQLLDVALGKQVSTINQHTAVPISAAELSAFVGTFEFSPSFSLSFAVDGDHLSAGAPGEPALPLMFEGSRSGHPTFYAQQVFAELEFIPNESGTINEVILHQAGHDETGHRR